MSKAPSQLGNQRPGSAIHGSPAVIIVGAGIAGCEAAWHCARAGVATLLITTSLDTSYNLARDKESLAPPGGSLLAEVAPSLVDSGGLVANFALHRAVKLALESEPKLHTLQATVSELLIEDEMVVGVRTWEGVERRAEVVALCVGSFFRARLSVGAVVEQQGRLSEMSFDDLYLDLHGRGLHFEERSFELAGQSGGLPYKVTTQVLAPTEMVAAGGQAAKRFQNLYAAGACLGEADGTSASYERAARQGLALGKELVARLAPT